MIKVKLDKILEDKHISLYKLSKDSGVEYATLHKILNNKTKSMNFNTLEKICVTLKCSPADLLVLEKQ